MSQSVTNEPSNAQSVETVSAARQENADAAASLFAGVKRITKFNATRITDYGLLGRYVGAWAEGRGHHTLVILGRPGILKSSMVKSTLDDAERDCLYVEGFTGPLALYRDLYLKLDKPVVLDDIKITESLRPILQPLWDNYDVHTVAWSTARPPKVYVAGTEDETIVADDDDEADEDAVEASDGKTGGQIIELPPRFQTRSRCCILTNTVERLVKMPALLDRAYIIEFDPPVADVLDRCRPFVNPAVWTWAKRHERLLPNLSARDLVQAGTDKKMGMPWEAVLRGRYLDPRTPLGAYLEVLADQRMATSAQRAERWTGLTGMNRATFYRVQVEYRKAFPSKRMPRGRSATLRLSNEAVPDQPNAELGVVTAGEAPATVVEAGQRHAELA